MTVALLRAGTLAFVTLAVATTMAQQTPPPPPPVETGLILGRTVDATTGKPVSGAVVTLGGGPTQPAAANAAVNPGAPATLSRFPMRVISDSNGRFVYHDLPAGVFSLSASKPGYVITAFGRSTPNDIGGQALILAEGDRRGDVTLKFWKFATVSGRVLDEAGEPVIGVQVRVFKRSTVNGRPGFTSFGNAPTTDDRGAYRIASLSPGDYVVGIITSQATVPTSLQAAYADAGKSGTIADVQRELDRSSSILDTIGSTGLGAGQRVGSWMLQTSSGPYRTATNPPTSNGKVFVYPTIFYPSASVPSRATIVTLGSGDSRIGIDLHLRPVVTSRISGTLAGPTGPEPRTSLLLLPSGADELQNDFAAASTVTDADGAFTFLGVTPGTYTIRTLKAPPRPVNLPSSFGTVIQTGTSTIYSGGGGPSTPPPIPNDPTWWAALPVTVGETDVTDVTVSLRTGARIMGHLEFEGTAQPPAAERLGQITIQVDTADGRSTSMSLFTLGRGVVDATGHFKTFQLPAGRYIVRALSQPSGWSFKSAMVNGRDISDAPLELGSDDVSNVVVTFTDRPSELSGTAHDSKGPDSTATVLVFPAQPALWVDHGAPTSARRFRALRVDTLGAYRSANLPVGEYFVVAVKSGVPSDWHDTKFLQQMAALATRVTIGDGEKKSVDVETKEVR